MRKHNGKNKNCHRFHRRYSKGSGTYQAAVLSRELFYEEHPEAKEQLAIHIIDSKTYSMAYGVGVIEGAQLVQTGASVQEVIAHIEDWLEHTRPVFIPLNLQCVKKSGRISPAAAFVGDAIGLKPLITFEDGEARIIGKARGERKAISALVERCMKERRPGANSSYMAAMPKRWIISGKPAHSIWISLPSQNIRLAVSSQSTQAPIWSAFCTGHK